MTNLIIVGDEAYTAQEWTARLARLERDRAYRQRPDVRARSVAYHREWSARNREKMRAYKREWMRRYRATNKSYVEADRAQARERMRRMRGAA